MGLRPHAHAHAVDPLAAIRAAAVTDAVGVHIIEAVAQPRGRRPVVEHMTQVAIAAGAADLGADHAVARVAQIADVVRVVGRGEAGPAASGLEFGRRTKQGQPVSQQLNTPLLLVE